ncbi:hypothetical protein [Nibricoccus sp. IMCC34717]|uniref:hypothetical protein n=1 Tax=Nibricoccus sp. IMCC34717 TaxID=3034021 RepID=UPI00384C4665
MNWLKNIVLAILGFACLYLYRTREDARVEISQARATNERTISEIRKELALVKENNQKLANSAAVPKTTTDEFQGANDPRLKAMMRQSIMTNTALTYANYFATCRLTRAEKEALFELLVDSCTPESDVQGADALKKNEELLLTLLGKDEKQRLEEQRRGEVARQQAVDALKSITKGRDWSEERLSKVAETFRGTFPQGYASDAITNRRKIDGIEAQALTKQFETDLIDRLNELKATLSEAELKSYEEWARAEYKKALDFGIMVTGLGK